MVRALIARLVPSLLAVGVAVAVGVIVDWQWGIAFLAVVHVATVGYHLWNVERLADWAAGPSDGPVPEGRGPWRAAFTALYRRARIRTAHERDLSHALAQFRSAADAMPDGIVVVDARGRVRWANRRAQAHLGVEAEKDGGRPLANVARQPELVRYVSSAEFTHPVIVESTREPGVTLSVQLVPFGADERLLISRDVTALHAVERMRRDFIANVSHELKTPLTVVAGFLETIHDLDLEPAAQRRYLELMQSQARSMQRLVDDLLTLSSLESQGTDVVETRFSIAPLVAEIAIEARALSGGAHEIVVGEGPAADVAGSREELRSAFANLVSNAVRYTPPGGRIVLAWALDTTGAGLFSVSDTGIGIASEHLPRLTERFYRVDRSRSRATGGTGLGLAIVKHVLLRHQAELLIASEPGEGSTFTVRLPPDRVLTPLGGGSAPSTGPMAAPGSVASIG